MIVDVFLNAIRDYVFGDTIAAPSHIAIGTGTGAVLAGDTTLDAEILPRNAITSQTKPSAKVVRLQTLIAAGEANGNVITEVGAFNAATGGTLTNRMLCSAITKESSFELKVQILIEFSDV